MFFSAQKCCNVPFVAEDCTRIHSFNDARLAHPVFRGRNGDLGDGADKVVLAYREYVL